MFLLLRGWSDDRLSVCPSASSSRSISGRYPPSELADLERQEETEDPTDEEQDVEEELEVPEHVGPMGVAHRILVAAGHPVLAGSPLNDVEDEHSHSPESGEDGRQSEVHDERGRAQRVDQDQEIRDARHREHDDLQVEKDGHPSPSAGPEVGPSPVVRGDGARRDECLRPYEGRAYEEQIGYGHGEIDDGEHERSHLDLLVSDCVFVRLFFYSPELSSTACAHGTKG